MSDAEEKDAGVKAEDAASPILIALTVRDDSNNEVTFKLKTTSLMGKLLTAYANQCGMALDSLRFFTPEGKRVQKTDSATTLDLKDGDIIDVHNDQTGGGWALP